jgi:hypothetical protein
MFRAFTDAVFDVLNTNIEPRNTGYLERTKTAAELLFCVEVMPDVNLSRVKDKWETKALYKAHNLEYVKRPPYGDALTRTGYATSWAVCSSVWSDEHYVIASLFAVRFGLRYHFVRQQFPMITPEAQEAAGNEF